MQELWLTRQEWKHRYSMLIHSAIQLINAVQNYWFTYNEQISVESVTQSVSNLAMQFGEDEEDTMVWTCVCCYFLTFSLPIESSIWNRPVDSRCGWKWTQTVCHWFYRYIYCTCFYSFHVDPSGTYMQYNAKAIGIYSITCDMLILMCMASRIRFRRRSNNLTGRIP